MPYDEEYRGHRLSARRKKGWAIAVYPPGAGMGEPIWAVTDNVDDLNAALAIARKLVDEMLDGPSPKP